MKRLFASVASVAALVLLPGTTASLAFAQNIGSSQAAAARVLAPNVAANKVGQDRLFVSSTKSSGPIAPQPSAAERALRQKLARQSVVGSGGKIEVTLNSAVEEVITVTSESPLLDQRCIRTGATVNAQELEKIPRSRDPWSVLQTTPSVIEDGKVNGPHEPVITIPEVNPPGGAGGADVSSLAKTSQGKPISTPAINTRGGIGAGFPLPPKAMVNQAGTGTGPMLAHQGPRERR